jgi:hypothetical protein
MSLIVTRRLSHDAGAQPLDENGNPLLQKTFVMVLDGKEVKTAAVWRGPLCSAACQRVQQLLRIAGMF